MANCYLNEFEETICRDNGWIYWGRWVVVGGVIATILGIYVIFACMSARRRHRLGVKPYMGTQWALGHNPPKYISTESLPTYTPSGNNAQNNTNHDVEAQRLPDAAHLTRQVN